MNRKSLYAVRRSAQFDTVPGVSVADAPSLTACSPSSGLVGSWLSVTGKNLLDVSRVVLDDGLLDCEYTFDPLTRALKVRVPTGTVAETTYSIKVYTPGGTATLFAAFTAF